MSNHTVYLSNFLLQAVNAIAEAGHGVELESGPGGNSHSTTIITIGVCRPNSVGYVTKMRLKYISSYQSFNNLIGLDDRFGNLCYYEQHSIVPFLEVIEQMEITV